MLTMQRLSALSIRSAPASQVTLTSDFHFKIVGDGR
jgi:hypothetical protein